MSEKIINTPIEIMIQGSPVVNDARIVEKTERLAAIEIDMKSKPCVYDGLFSDGIHQCLCIGATEESVHLNPEAVGFTMLRFTDFKGWEIFAATVSRYTACVCLRKTDDL